MQVFNPKIPILMYHEVSKDFAVHKKIHQLTPLYNISVAMFEDQLRLLSEQGYTSVLFEDISQLSKVKKYVVLTFDDGLKGNCEHALPILMKYGFKAIFFVSVDSIGSEGFMTWEELRKLVSAGMSVQSHGLSHRPLQTLNDKEIHEELFVSKQLIEEKLRTRVSALSFPHGSYNQKIVYLAQEVGYRFMCTSQVEYTYHSSFQREQIILGRIAVTNKLNIERFCNIVEYKRNEIMRQKFEKSAKNGLKKLIGIENYRRLYRKYFNIKEN